MIRHARPSVQQIQARCVRCPAWRGRHRAIGSVPGRANRQAACLTCWVRLRLTAAMWQQWKTPRRRRAALLELGVRPRLASSTAGSWLGPWYFAKTKALAVGLSNAHFKSLGRPLRTQATSINIPVNTQDRHTEKLKLRESLTAEIVA